MFHKLRPTPRIDNVLFGGHMYVKNNSLVTLQSNYARKIIRTEPWNTNHRIPQNRITTRRALTTVHRWINSPSMMFVDGNLGNLYSPHSPSLLVRNDGRWIVVHLHRPTLRIIHGCSKISISCGNDGHAKWFVNQSTDVVHFHRLTLRRMLGFSQIRASPNT